MKFGGTSVANAVNIKRVISIVAGRLEKRPVVVVSALAGVTDSLYRICASLAASDVEAAEWVIDGLKSKHEAVIRELIPEDSNHYRRIRDEVYEVLDRLQELSRAIGVIGELSDRSKAVIISTGEFLSAKIICAAMNYSGIRTKFADSRKMIITDEVYLKGEPDIEQICLRVPDFVGQAFAGSEAVITQGFVSSTIEGTPTVLGRGGSDFTASLIGQAMKASVIEIWTDVNGVHTADPRKVKKTRSNHVISFEEAAEMANCGAKVLHQRTMEPAVREGIPIRVLNSFSPEDEGTIIFTEAVPGVKAVSSNDKISVLSIRATDTIVDNVVFVQKVLSYFQKERIQVRMMSLLSGGVTVVIDESSDLTGLLGRLAGFAKVEMIYEKSQISIVGKDVVQIDGLFGKVFGGLLDKRISMITKSASGISLSFIADVDDVTEILNIIHRELFETE